ncbi:MAG: N-ethylmaleimide reductase, partial [Phenylobacterium sp.]
MTQNLFESYRLNSSLTLKNRIIMAPMTRCMADDDLVPTSVMAEYYGRRAEAGLIISEATLIRPDGQGFPNTPGLFTGAQIRGWAKVTDAVHQQGGKMFAQLWHCGRAAHPHFFADGSPASTFVLAPSAVALTGNLPRMAELQYVPPKAATIDEINGLIKDYAQAANNAIEAGFDGVEIHGGNGYLIEQFLHYDSNRRTDEYGGSPENMARFALAVTDAVIEQIGHERTSLRISPGGHGNIATDSRDRAVLDELLAQLAQRNLAFVHIGIFDDSQQFDFLGGSASEYVRANYHQSLVGVGGYNAQTASVAIAEDKFDLISFARAFIANPDYVTRV